MTLTLEVAEADVTDYLQDRSLRLSPGTCDFTLIDPATEPALGDDILITDADALPDDIGGEVSYSVSATESSTWRSPEGTDHRFIKVTGTDNAFLEDFGAAPFGLSDEPDGSTTYPYRDRSLTVRRTQGEAGGEVRASIQTAAPGLWQGMTLELTSAAEGFSAETFTIMDISIEWPTADAPLYTLDLGLGDFTTATEAGLEPERLGESIIETEAQEGGALDAWGCKFLVDDSGDTRMASGRIVIGADGGEVAAWDAQLELVAGEGSHVRLTAWNSNDPVARVEVHDEGNIRLEGTSAVGLFAPVLVIDALSLPTSDPASEGQLWRDGTTLKVSLG